MATRPVVALHRYALAWASILVTIGVTQAVRGVPIDASIFFGAALLIVVDSLRGPRPTRQSWTRPPRGAVVVSVLVLAAALVFAPRHGVLLAAALGLAGVVVLVLAWVPRASESSETDGRAILRSMAWWAGLVAAIGLWELASFVWHFHGAEASYDHPTVSDLLNSVLDTAPGRVVFAAVWLALGTVAVRPRLIAAKPRWDDHSRTLMGGGR